MLRNYTHACALVAAVGTLTSCVSPREGLPEYPKSADRHIALPGGPAAVVQQGWEPRVANWWYNVAQGSKLLPYDWFLCLEQPGKETLFSDAGYLGGLGFIPRNPDADGGNPDGLPVGFTRDAHSISEDSKLGQKYPLLARYNVHLGLNCAACHTGVVTVRGKPYVVDGAPSLANHEKMVKDMTAALEQTRSDAAKRERFRTRLIARGGKVPADDMLVKDLELAIQERRNYDRNNLPPSGGTPFGHGRLDAFGAIINQVTSEFLGVPENQRPATAPVSFPFIWDAPQHDFVQWPGFVQNRIGKKRFQEISEHLFGTDAVGSLGRNAGEVLGVFGKVSYKGEGGDILFGYDSTVKRKNLIHLENTLANLWSPQLKDILPDLDQAKVARGAKIYEDKCVSCHAHVDRDDPGRRITADNRNVGTDTRMVDNLLGRMAKTKELAGRPATIESKEKLQPEEKASTVTRHVSQRVVIGPKFFKSFSRFKDSESRRVFAGAGQNGELILGEGSVAVRGNVASSTATPSAVVMEYGKDASLELLEGGEDPEAKWATGVKALETGASTSFSVGKTTVVKKPEGYTVTTPAAPGTVLPGTYKGRPLNGIWATAPYLHNASVPSMYDLLLPAAQRPATFYVGSTEYDEKKMGFDQTKGPFLFDTRDPTLGNSNAGHEVYGNQRYVFDPSVPEEKQAMEDLIEYLKTL